MGKLVFVYGSLKRGFWNHHLLEAAKFLGEAITLDRFLVTNVGFPYMIPEDRVSIPNLKEQVRPVLGEVFLVNNEETLRRLDALEGVAYSHYTHHNMKVKLGDEIKEVVAYVPCDDRVQQYPIASWNEEGAFKWS